MIPCINPSRFAWIAAMAILPFGSYAQLFAPGAGVVDIDGHTYPTIVLGSQEWMAANLRSTRFADGQSVPHVVPNFQWNNLNGPAWCHFEHQEDFEIPYGKLYSGFTLEADNKICPAGWRLPYEEDWNILAKYLDANADTTCVNCVQSAIAGGFMKSIGTTYWLEPNTGAGNESGFSGHGGGSRNGNGTFSSRSQSAWWSASESFHGGGVRWYRQLRHNDAGLYRYATGTPRQAFYVRCLKDMVNTSSAQGFVPPVLPAVVYPNPADHVVNVVLPHAARLYVYDAQGRPVVSAYLDSGTQQIDVSNWPAGVYVLRLHAAEGVAVLRLVRQ